jgi:hypothetical protein
MAMSIFALSSIPPKVCVVFWTNCVLQRALACARQTIRTVLPRYKIEATLPKNILGVTWDFSL